MRLGKEKDFSILTVDITPHLLFSDRSCMLCHVAKKKRNGNKNKVKLGEELVDNLLLHSSHSRPTVPCPLPYRAAERLDTRFPSLPCS